MAKVLYITYDGILEPLGQSQVLNYLEKLSEDERRSVGQQASKLIDEAFEDKYGKEDKAGIASIIEV